MKKRKRVLVMSDLHCGHRVGLTHPGFDRDTEPEREAIAWNMRRVIWDWFTSTTDSMGKIDVLIVNGDAVDGKGKASGGTELLTTDRNDQVEMAVAAINYIGAGAVFMSYGTPYHTGKMEDWEDAVAREAKRVEKIGGEDTIEINGLNINYRHYVGSSSIPHGRHTAVAKEKMWNALWGERGEYPAADVVVRSHVHYHAFCGGAGWLAMTTPSLQGYGTKFGGRRMSGTVDIGMVVFNIDKSGGYSWKPVLLRLPFHNPISL